MSMPKARPVLQPKAQHAIHADMSEPCEGDTRQPVIPPGPRDAQQQNPRRLGMHAVVQGRPHARVGQISRHAQVREQQPARKGPPRAARLPVRPHGRAQDARAFEAEQMARPGLDDAVFVHFFVLCETGLAMLLLAWGWSGANWT